MEVELCGAPTPNGPCTMKKGHYAKWHRHRQYDQVTWTIESVTGVTLKSGKARVPLNYALTEVLENNSMVVIHVKTWRTGASEDGSVAA